MIIFKVASRCFPATINMHVLQEYNNRWRQNSNKVRVLQYFNILSKLKLLENLYIVLQIYAQCEVRCKGLNIYPYIYPYAIKSIFLLFQRSCNWLSALHRQYLKLFHLEQRDLTRNKYICVETSC